MKILFLVCPFYCFFRLQIYEAMAAIFWQSGSYVLNGFPYPFIVHIRPSFVANTKFHFFASFLLTCCILSFPVHS